MNGKLTTDVYSQIFHKMHVFSSTHVSPYTYLFVIKTFNIACDSKKINLIDNGDENIFLIWIYQNNFVRYICHMNNNGDENIFFFKKIFTKIN